MIVQMSKSAEFGGLPRILNLGYACEGTKMIQCRLRELMASTGRNERRKITYQDIRSRTGLSTTTLVRLANDRASMVGISVIDRLCAYFQCQPGDLFVYVEETDDN